MKTKSIILMTFVYCVAIACHQVQGAADDIFSDLITEARELTPPFESVNYPPLGSYGCAGGDAENPNYPAYIEVGFPGWDLMPLQSRNTYQPVTVTIELLRYENTGEAELELDFFEHFIQNPHREVGRAPEIEHTFFKLGSDNQSSSEFGQQETYEDTCSVDLAGLMNAGLSSLPAKLSTGPGWPSKLIIHFDQLFGQNDLDLRNRYFALGSVRNPNHRLKTVHISYGVNGTPYYRSQAIHMGWATKEQSFGKVDFPNVTFQDHNAVQLRGPWLHNHLDQYGWYFQQFPRGSATIEPMALYDWRQSTRRWRHHEYNEALFLWGMAGSGVRSLRDSDYVQRLAPEVSYFTGFRVGRVVYNGGYPEILNVRGNGFLRMTDFGGVMAGSFRPVSSDVFGLFKNKEDFPLMPRAYTRMIATGSRTANDCFGRVFLSVQSKLADALAGALSIDIHAIPEDSALATNMMPEVYMDVTSFLVAKKDINHETDGPMNFFAQSSLFWRGGPETNTKSEAHDLDVVMIEKADGDWITHQIRNPQSHIVHRMISSFELGDTLYLQQQDRGATSYGFETASPYRRASSFIIQLLQAPIHPLTIDIFEQHTQTEANDNIVIAGCLNADLHAEDEIEHVLRYSPIFAPGVYISQPNTVSSKSENDLGKRGRVRTASTYTIKFTVTDPDSRELDYRVYIGNGKKSNWDILEEGSVQSDDEKVVIWDLRNIKPGAYYVKVEANRPGSRKIGFDVSNTRLMVKPDEAPISVSADLVNAPAKRESGLPVYQPGDIVTIDCRLTNLSLESFSNLQIKTIQEYGETVLWLDDPHHASASTNVHRAKGDRLAGNPESDKTISLAAKETRDIQFTYTVPLGRKIYHEDFAIPYPEDFYVFRNDASIIQTRIIIRKMNGDALLEADNVLVYRISDGLTKL